MRLLLGCGLRFLNASFSPRRLRSLIVEIRSKAKEEHNRLRRDQRKIETPNQICMIDILDESSPSRFSIPQPAREEYLLRCMQTTILSTFGTASSPVEAYEQQQGHGRFSRQASRRSQALRREWTPSRGRSCDGDQKHSAPSHRGARSGHATHSRTRGRCNPRAALRPADR